MAYGMRASELAKVGQNVNNQGSGVSEESIQTALDEELDAERKETIQRNKNRAAKARVQAAENKSAMRSAIIQSVGDVALKAGTAVSDARAENPEVQAKKAERVSARKGAKVDRIKAKQAKFKKTLPEKDPTARQVKRTKRFDARLGRAETQASRAKKIAGQRRYEADFGAYSGGGSLYGKKPGAVSYTLGETESELFNAADGTKPKVAPVSKNVGTQKKAQ